MYSVPFSVFSVLTEPVRAARWFSHGGSRALARIVPYQRAGHARSGVSSPASGCYSS